MPRSSFVRSARRSRRSDDVLVESLLSESESGSRYDQVPEPKYRRPKKSRPLLTAFLVGSGLVVLVCLIAALAVRAHFENQANKFPLELMAQMEAGSLVHDRDNNVIGTIFIQNRDPIPLSEVPIHTQNAILAAEDARFYAHGGVDYIRVMGAAFYNYQAGRVTQGGSTITMQLARNTYGLLDRSMERKVVEMFLAHRIERNFSKPEILEHYLNRIFFGVSFYGIEAAARGYFGKRTSQLSIGESAMLAGLIKSPNNLSPWANLEVNLQQRNLVLNRMHELRMISKDELEQSLAEQPRIQSRRQDTSRSNSHALDYIRRQVIDQIGFENATEGGFRIFTTLDSSLQEKAEESLNRRLQEIELRTGYTHPTLAQHELAYRDWLAKANGAEGAVTPPTPQYLQGAALILDNDNGAILAMVGGREFGHSQFNRALQARRPVGTAFKPIVYASAFAQGMFPGQLIEDSAIDNRQVMIGGTTGILGEWGAERMDNRYEGTIPARHALAKGKNAASVRVGMLAGLDSVMALAQRFGIQAPLRPFPATFLGSSEVSLHEMTLAYSVFPGAGWRPETSHIIRRIETGQGEVVYQSRPQRLQVLDERVAYQVHTALSDSLEWGSADKAINRYGLRRFPAGGKTGTAYDFTDVWFLGYQSRITVGVWAGFDKPTSIYRGAFSSDITLPVWVEIMNAAVERYAPAPINQPQGLERVEVSLKTGLRAGEGALEQVQDPVTGQWIEKRNTVFELGTDDQLRLLDSQGGLRMTTRTAEGQDWPVAQAVLSAENTRPVAILEATVLGVDPYSAVTPEIFAARSEHSMTPGGEEEEVEIRRPERVRPIESEADLSLEDFLTPPPPLEF
ncbi:MAG: transglycosylase domain-containing protein [Verrucomicrobiales bacterium]